jgi:hypothetical protein
MHLLWFGLGVARYDDVVLIFQLPLPKEALLDGAHSPIYTEAHEYLGEIRHVVHGIQAAIPPKIDQHPQVNQLHV